MGPICRLRIKLEALQVSIVVLMNPRSTGDANPKPASLPAVSTDNQLSKPCPRCGEPWLRIMRTATKEEGDIPEALRGAGLHVGSSGTGRLWICRGSFERCLSAGAR